MRFTHYSEASIAIERVVMSLVGRSFVGDVRKLWLNGASEAYRHY